MKANAKIAVGLVVLAAAFVAIRYFFPLLPCPPLNCR